MPAEVIAESYAKALLVEMCPALKPLPFVGLGKLPTPVQHPPWGEACFRSAFVKRDDLSSPLYGGNKVRTLEPLLGLALQRGCSRVLCVGAFGSNHAVASILHAERVGLPVTALLFPQPYSDTANENLAVSLALADELRLLPHWSLLPLAWWRARAAYGQAALMMPAGGATPYGALGYLAAALELSQQVKAGELPAPSEIVLPVGSTCTSAGLLLGLTVARRMGWWVGARPVVRAVRVTPWPITSMTRIVGLAAKTGRWLGTLCSQPQFVVSRAELASGLRVDGRQLGLGYGIPTPAGLGTIARFGTRATGALDTTYSAKALAALCEYVREDPGVPRLFWSTKSSAVLPQVGPTPLPPRFLRRFCEPGWQEATRGSSSVTSSVAER